MKGLLFRSIENKERIEMIYMDKSGQISQRVIRVLKINDEKNSCLLLHQERSTDF